MKNILTSVLLALSLPLSASTNDPARAVSKEGRDQRRQQLLRKYDQNKNGVLEQAELSAIRKDQNKRLRGKGDAQVQTTQLTASTNLTLTVTNR